MNEQRINAEQCLNLGNVGRPEVVGQMAGRISGAMSDSVGRPSAKSLIRGRANQLREEAARLDALCRALPEELSPAADQALWDLATARR